MTRVEAIFENGALRPLSPVELRENERVELIIQQLSPAGKTLSWDEVQEHLEEMRRKFGTLPDSTPLIAEDRMRDI